MTLEYPLMANNVFISKAYFIYYMWFNICHIESLEGNSKQDFKFE